MSSPKTFQGYLQDKGLKSTHQRDDIVSYFLQKSKHFTVKELYREVQNIDPKIGYATVHRTLKLLVDAGLATECRFSGGITRFESVKEGEHHDHLVCLKCGKIIEFENDKIEQLQIKVAKEHNFTLADHKCVLYGYCSGCRE
jgi:Fur family ferric uptake transcriptional regulator